MYVVPVTVLAPAMLPVIEQSWFGPTEVLILGKHIILSGKRYDPRVASEAC